MKRKARIQSGVDDRLVAIYARKSRITTTFWSMMATCSENHLNLTGSMAFLRTIRPIR